MPVQIVLGSRVTGLRSQVAVTVLEASMYLSLLEKRMAALI